MNDRILALESIKWDPLGKPSSFILAPPVNLIRVESKEGIDVQSIHSRVCITIHHVRIFISNNTHAYVYTQCVYISYWT